MIASYSFVYTDYLYIFLLIDSVVMSAVIRVVMKNAVTCACVWIEVTLPECVSVLGGVVGSDGRGCHCCLLVSCSVVPTERGGELCPFRGVQH